MSERTRERIDQADESVSNTVFNTSRPQDREAARQKLMDRFNRGESVLQPPGDESKSLGQAIRDQLDQL